ncbi:MAG: hypothetical protein PHR61_00950 [Candidatus Absconditabacteria bacterium]|nr:hypothetical protein [Candidatus Absconditabacteria bacterium]
MIKKLPVLEESIKFNLLNITENIGEDKIDSVVNTIKSVEESLIKIENDHKQKIKELIENFVYDYLQEKNKGNDKFIKNQKLIKQLEILQQEEKQDVENILDKLSLI